MGGSFKNICDNLILPDGCREHFVPLQGSVGEIFRQHQVSLGGISELLPGYEAARRDPWFHVMLYVLEGGARLETEGDSALVRPGELLVIPAHTGHRYGVARVPFRILWFHLSLRRAWSQLDGRPWEVRTQHEGTGLLAATEGLLREAGRPGMDSVRASILNAELIVTLLRREVTATADARTRQMDERLWQLWRHVDSHLAHPWTVSELARQAHMSTSHFHRIMAGTYGLGPMQKVTALRMDRAAVLLENTPGSVSEIASRVGYENPFAFSTAFKRHFGRGPREYRATTLGLGQVD